MTGELFHNSYDDFMYISVDEQLVVIETEHFRKKREARERYRRQKFIEAVFTEPKYIRTKIDLNKELLKYKIMADTFLKLKKY
jgi:hypothetical protein